ncbi:uncharacterized protein [Lolium perenne]|uniref:uncharacterized protein isoform X1 n=1 Tax=Lolium perenne TaxID=4522 RepID=UPI0021F6893A|nr:uncharacterized protein LOC127322173 isoform X1 [Lolium perenne]
MDADDNARDEEIQRIMHLLGVAHDLAVLGYYGNLYSEKYLNKATRRIPQQTGLEWVHEQLDDRKRCYKMFRMYPDVFEQLHNLLVASYGLESTRDMESVECLGMFLWMVGGPQSFHQVENRFSRSLETIHRKFNMVLNCLYNLGKDNIKPVDRNFTDVHPRIQDPRFWPHFKGAIGAIDGSHIPVEVPKEEEINHTGRHGYTSQNLLAICDFDLRFTFVVAGWPGSAHDTRILNHSIVKYPQQFPTPPDGTYYLVDSGYPNRKGFLAPYKNNTYHLPDFRREGLPTKKEEIFNYAHAQIRNAIERNFGILKNKWRMLKGIPSYGLVTQKKIILACIALHNFIRDSHLRDKQFDRCDSDENYIPKVQRQSITTPGDSAPGGQHTSSMNSTRDDIANALFNARAT